MRVGNRELACHHARGDHLPHPPLVVAAVLVDDRAVLRRERGQLVQPDDVLGAAAVQVVQVGADQRREPLRRVPGASSSGRFCALGSSVTVRQIA